MPTRISADNSIKTNFIINLAVNLLLYNSIYYILPALVFDEVRKNGITLDKISGTILGFKEQAR
jgi:hypothetical protein